VHPLSIAAFRLTAVSRLGSGDPAAPENDYLPLLPSGSDGVRRFSPRRTQSSTPLSRRSPTMPDLEREFNPAVADCGYRAPLVPRLARPLILPNGPPNVKEIGPVVLAPHPHLRYTTADRCTRSRGGGILATNDENAARRDSAPRKEQPSWQGSYATPPIGTFRHSGRALSCSGGGSAKGPAPIPDTTLSGCERPPRPQLFSRPRRG
jgi:hypothetical protein